MGLRQWIRGDDITLELDQHAENRTLTRENVPGVMLPYARRHLHHHELLDANPSNALHIADAYACVRVLSDAVASLPPKIYRETGNGRVPVGADQRLAALLRQPSPGSTSCDLFGTIMANLQTHGNAFVGKYRSDGEITQLGCLPPSQVRLELRGNIVTYFLSRIDGVFELGLSDVVHIKAMSSDHLGANGLLGLSPVSQCRLALSLSANLQESAKQYFENGSRPSGILNLPEGTSTAAMNAMREEWRNLQSLQAGRMHSVAVLEGESNFTPIGFSADDSQFLQQRQLSAVEVARIFRVPPHLIGAPTGESMTYSNVLEENRHFVTHSLRPWLVRIERALSNDPELCPGGTFLEFDLDSLLRSDLSARALIYQQALGDGQHPAWMTVDEVRQQENLPPMGGATP